VTYSPTFTELELRRILEWGQAFNDKCKMLALCSSVAWRVAHLYRKQEAYFPSWQFTIGQATQRQLELYSAFLQCHTALLRAQPDFYGDSAPPITAVWGGRSSEIQHKVVEPISDTLRF
jgi:hypothetical protein